MASRVVVGAFLLCASAVACVSPDGAPEEPDFGTWVGTITTEGDVTTVVNESGSVWGGTATLVEELSIGVEAGAEEYMLGLVVDVRATADRIYVLDRRPRVLRVYDMEGRHLFDVGRQGQGPGEYRTPQRIAVGIDGRVFVQEISRVTVFTSDGEYLETWPAPVSIDVAHDVVATSGGRLFVAERARGVRPPGRILSIVNVVQLGPLAPDGAGVVVPDYGTYPHLEATDGYKASVPFWPIGAWAFTSTEALIHGIPDEYRFRIEKRDGSVIVVERVAEAIAVEDDEAEWHRRYTIARMRAHEQGWSWDGRPVPDVKPFFSSFGSDTDGQVWVTRAGAGIRIADCDENPLVVIAGQSRRCWRSENLIDVFDADGRFLGAVEYPGFGSPRTYRVRGTSVFTWGLDDEGVPMVKRYRLVLPER